MPELDERVGVLESKAEGLEERQKHNANQIGSSRETIAEHGVRIGTLEGVAEGIQKALASWNAKGWVIVTSVIIGLVIQLFVATKK